jgi:HAD superfamily hydrolase (TIGR01509 family)
MPIQLVIFDCDGVLVDSEPITTATWVAALAEFGLTWTADDLDRSYRGGKLADVVAAAEAALGGPLPGDFVERFRERLYERLRIDVRPVPGIHEALDALPYATCVASNGPRAKMEATLGSTGLMARFEGRVFSAYDIDSFKPEPGLFLHAARTCGVAPARCVVVEDSDTGIRAARAAGMTVLAFGLDRHASFTEHAPRLAAMTDLPAALAALDTWLC